MHNWEILLHFAVHGQAKHLYGDGFAFWYTKERGQLGPAMGNQDFFTGLGIIFDTYSNHNGEHVVSYYPVCVCFVCFCVYVTYVPLLYM